MDSKTGFRVARGLSIICRLPLGKMAVALWYNFLLLFTNQLNSPPYLSPYPPWCTQLLHLIIFPSSSVHLCLSLTSCSNTFVFTWYYPAFSWYLPSVWYGGHYSHISWGLLKIRLNLILSLGSYIIDCSNNILFSSFKFFHKFIHVAYIL